MKSLTDHLTTIEAGNWGEDKALEYLRANNYKVLETKWRYRHKEIDIIAQLNDLLVIVEVKMRSFDSYETPEAAVTKKKQKFLIEAADAYIRMKDLETETRFDIISVIKNKDQFNIDHDIDAYTPEW